ncbi:phage capsid protein [Micromonospora rifamycinica]|uniref:phage capsid protein n=1 Tax=Micromonospora rifamycinica TaxID=291594 RepID=UPI00341CD7E9
MPIPTGGAWPPPAYAPAYDAYRDWDAWYVGDPGELQAVYSRRGVSTPRVRPSQLVGGVVGMLSRWMWGNPVRSDQRDTRLHVPVPADLAATSAGLLFSEPPTLTSETLEVQAAIERLIEGGLHTTLRHAAEHASVLGDVYLRPVVDKEVSPAGAIVTAVPADAAIPVIRWGRLTEVTLWSTLEESAGTVVRLLEHHDVARGAGRITYALYEGDATDLGRAIPLTEHLSAAYLAKVVDETSAQATGLDRLDVVRIPNAGPQRRWRKLAALKSLGRSDMDGNEPLFDRIDEVWTAWMRDIRIGQGRITVPEYMLQSNGAGAGATWDADREVYSAINALPTPQGAGVGLTVSQFAIRHVEHKATADALMEAAMRHAGLSAQTMGEEGDVAMTATEATARERQSFVTRGDRTTVWKAELGSYVELHLALERVHFGGPAEERPNVEFGDSVTESPEVVARTAQLLHAAEAASIETKVRMVHPEWDKEQVADEVKKIKEETGAGQPAPDPAGRFGQLAGNDPAGQDGQPEE